jgi:hypothetical protein
VIREAKGVALHDLSFWSDTLPLLDGLPRVIREYQRNFSPVVPMSLDTRTGRLLHDSALSSFMDRVSRGAPATNPTRPGHLGEALFELLAATSHPGRPSINVPITGCGVVIGGSCDLLWQPHLVEVKLTRTEPALRDVRQVLMYAALLHLAARAEGVDTGIVANPRLGVAVEFSIDELLMMTGGLTMDEFASRLAQFLVSAAQSN